jgi:hypothetical protein
MAELNMRRISTAVVLTAGLVLGGCFQSDGDNRTEGYDNPPGTVSIPPPPATSTKFRPLFAVTGCATGGTGPCLLPFPTDLFYTGTTDGTLNIPATAYALATTPLLASLNAQDGYSTTASIDIRFDDGPINATTLTAANMRVVELYLSNTTKAPASGAELPPGVTSPVRRVLAFGTDFTATVATEADSGGELLKITPRKPLTPSTGATNIGYLVLLTNGIRSAAGAAAVADSEYAQIQAAPADCSTITNATLNGVCRLTKAHLQIAAGVGLTPANVVMSFSFSTQNTSDSLGALAQLVPAQAIGVVPTGFNTKQANAAFSGKADIWAGTTVVPYYLTASATVNDPAVLTKFWTAAGASPVPGIDPASRNVTRFNPVPAKTADLTIPLLMTSPNGTANGGVGCVKPPLGWPVVIFQHGLGGDRTQLLAIADAYADACFLVAGIDAPLHGITSVASPFYQAGRERTFNVDLINNATLAPPADGITDASGAHWINLTSPLTSRDNWRQAFTDIGTLAKSLTRLDLNGDTVPDIDPNRIHYGGISLGGIIGAGAAKFSPVIRTAALSVPGGRYSTLVNDSVTFGPQIRAGLAAQGLIAGTSLYAQFFRDFQAALDAGDSANHIAGSAAAKPVYVTQVVGDAVVPNTSTRWIYDSANLRRISTVGPNAVSAGNGVWVNFIAGSHSSLLSPSASLATTVEMQSQMVQFTASAAVAGGPFVVITNPTVIEP